MVKVKNIDDLLAEQAVRKVATCYSRGVDRTDLDLLNSAFHDDAEVRYGSYDGHYAELQRWSWMVRRIWIIQLILL